MIGPRLCLVALALAGCSSLSGLSGGSDYACKAPEGVTCDSVSGVYANALQNNLPSQRQRESSKPAGPSRGDNKPTGASSIGLAPTPVALRSSARVLRMWFKPWEDADHDLYDQGYVYVQVDSGQWRIDHVQREIRDSYAPLKAPAGAASSAASNTPAGAPSLGSPVRPSLGDLAGRRPAPAASGNVNTDSDE